MSKDWYTSEEIATRIKWPAEYIPRLAREHGWQTRTTNGKPLWTRGARYEFYWPDVGRTGLKPHKKVRRAKKTVYLNLEGAASQEQLARIRERVVRIKRMTGSPAVIQVADEILADLDAPHQSKSPSALEDLFVE